MKRIIFIVALSVALAPIFCSGTDYYVDSQAASSGAGTQASPFATIQEGINAAIAGDTVYVKGNLFVSQASQRVVIPADKPELTLAKWADENGEYPRFVGAREPIVLALKIHLR